MILMPHPVMRTEQNNRAQNKSELYTTLHFNIGVKANLGELAIIVE